MFKDILDKVKVAIGGKALSDADLVVELEKKAEGKGLNWKTSVVDFLRLLEVDSSSANREALAKELGVDPKLPAGSPAKNEALRVAVFKKLAENGGKIPKTMMIE